MARTCTRSLALLALIAGTCITASAHFDDPNPLSGPKVKDTGVPGESKSFTNSESKLKYENRMISEKVFKETIEYMRSSQVEPALRLTEEQMKKVRDEEQKLNTQRREFLAKNKETLAKLLADAGVKNADLSTERGIRQAMERARESAGELKAKRAQPDGKPAAERPVKDEDSMMQKEAMGEQAAAGTKAAALQQLAEIRRNFPKTEDQHAAVWAVLSAPQREVAETKLKELMAKESEQRMLPGVKNQVERQLNNDKLKKKADKKPFEKKPTENK